MGFINYDKIVLKNFRCADIFSHNLKFSSSKASQLFIFICCFNYLFLLFAFFSLCIVLKNIYATNAKTKNNIWTKKNFCSPLMWNIWFPLLKLLCEFTENLTKAMWLVELLNTKKKVLFSHDLKR